MDAVQKFIAENSHQFGYIMNEAERQWREKDNNGALTVGPCAAFVDEHGNYHDLLDKIEKMEQRLKENHLPVDPCWQCGKEEKNPGLNVCGTCYHKQIWG